MPMIILARIKLSSCNVNVFDRIRMKWLACVEAIEEESRWSRCPVIYIWKSLALLIANCTRLPSIQLINESRRSLASNDTLIFIYGRPRSVRVIMKFLPAEFNVVCPFFLQF